MQRSYIALILGFFSVTTFTWANQSCVQCHDSPIPFARLETIGTWSWDETPKMDISSFPTTKAGAWNAPADDEKRKALLADIASWRKQLTLTDPQKQLKANPAAKDFPGIPNDGAPLVKKGVLIDQEQPGWHSTGLYALPGVPITVRLPEGLKLQTTNDKKKSKATFTLRVGCHTDRLILTRNKSWKRTPEIAFHAPLEQTTTTFTSPFGGLIYIDLAQNNPLTRPAMVEIANATPAPLYRLGKTTPEQWAEQLNTSTPWGEIDCGRLIVSLPIGQLKQIADIQAIAQCLSDAMDLQDWLIAWDDDTPQMKKPMRFVVDRQISVGGGHAGYPGFPAMGHLNWGNPFADGSLLKNGSWGLWHELGHNHQFAPFRFDGCGEVTVNLFSLLCQTKLLNIPMGKTWGGMKGLEAKRTAYLKATHTYDQEKDLGLKLGFFVDIITKFGFDPFHQVAKTFHTTGYPQQKPTNQDKWDYLMINLSQATQHNLAPHFTAWRTSISEKATQDPRIQSLPIWGK